MTVISAVDCLTPQQVMYKEHDEELERILPYFLQAMGLADTPDNRQGAKDMYDMGYDHGSTMEAEFGER